MKQLLVVGAGASHELDFPLGSGLLDEIIKGINKNPKYQTNKAEGPFTDFLNNYFKFIDKNSNDAGFFEENEQTYRQKLLPLKVELETWRKNSLSIDSFLKFHESKREYQVFGKFAIAFFMIGHEEWLMRENLYAFKNNWLRAFVERHFARYLQNISTGKNELQIITFNYDRCIEHFLYNYIRHQSQIPITGWDETLGSDKAKEAVDTPNIIHVYSSLADLEWQNRLGKAVRFGERNNDKGSVILASGNIQLIAESGIGRIDTFKRQKIQEGIRNAEKIYFLGFGFDSENMDILLGDGIKDMKFTTHADCIATGYGLDEKIVKKYPFINFHRNSRCFDLVENLSVFRF